MRPKFIRIARGGDLLGCHYVMFWRRAKRGDFGPISFDDQGRARVSRAEVERVAGHPFTDAQIEAAHSRPNPDRRKPKADRKPPAPPLYPSYSRFDLERAIYNAVNEHHQAWLRWCHDPTERALHPNGPSPSAHSAFVP